MMLIVGLPILIFGLIVTPLEDIFIGGPLVIAGLCDITAKLMEKWDRKQTAQITQKGGRFV